MICSLKLKCYFCETSGKIDVGDTDRNKIGDTVERKCNICHAYTNHEIISID